MERPKAIFLLIAFTVMNSGFESRRTSYDYASIKIGAKGWMIEDLNVTRFRNGDAIPEARGEKAWDEAAEKGQPAWSYYNDDPGRASRYGRYYNWYAVVDPRGIAPKGWHVSRVEDWNDLFNTMGGIEEACLTRDIQDAVFLDVDGNEHIGFPVLCGYHWGGKSHGAYIDGVGFYWTSDTHDNFCVELSPRNLGCLINNKREKSMGFKVRCVED